MQGNLFGYTEPRKTRFDIHPRARKSNPDTSHEAAKRVDEFADKHKAKILKALEIKPMGKDRIARHTGLEPIQVSRRLSELRREGKVEMTDQKELSNAKRNERIWRLKTIM